MRKIIRKILKRIVVDITISRNSKWGSWWNYRHGFSKATVEVCGINKFNYRKFVSDRLYYFNHPYNGSCTSIIDNKLWLPFFLSTNLEFCPQYYFYKDDSGFLDLETNTRVSFLEFKKKLINVRKIACKHTHSAVGVGFFVLSCDRGDYFCNNKKISEIELQNKLEHLSEYIFTEYVIQHDYAMRISRNSLNTLRLLTVWDFNKKNFYVARAFHRFGVGESVVDNIGQGSGVLSFVNVDTGELTGEGAVNINNSGDTYCKNIIHPTSNIDLSGVRIPHYKEVVQTILKICNEHSYMRYIGWDIAITEDGFKVIETNSFSALEVIQQREGFFEDDNLRRIISK